MKYIVISLFIFVCSINLFTQEMDYEKLQYDFYGVLSVENKLICYGSSGYVLVSTNDGEDWKSVKIFDDSLTIKKMIYYDGSIYGICYNGYSMFYSGIVFKTDLELNLINWNQNNKSNIYYDLVVNENLYILSSNNSVLVFNSELTQTNEILIDSLYRVNNIVYMNNNLYLPTQLGKIFTINLNDNYAVSSIDVSSFGQKISQVISKGSSLLLNLDKKGYEVELETKEIKQISDTVNLLLFNDNELYDLRKKTDLLKNVAWIELYKMENDSFKLVTIDSIDRYVTPDLSIRNYVFFNKNHIVAVGTNKTIYISNTNGVNWSLKSMLKPYGTKYWLNEISGYSIDSQGQIFRTVNGGITWLPQKFTLPTIKYAQSKGSLESTFFMNENGKGYYWCATQSISKDTSKLFNTLYTDDFGETFISKWDWGFGSKYDLFMYASQFQVDCIDIDNSLITSIVPRSGDHTYNNLTFIFEIDPEFNKSKSTKIDSTSIIALTKFDNRLYGLMWERRYPNKDKASWFDSTKKWIASSVDKGKTWNFEFDCIMDPNIIDFYRYKKENILLIESTQQVKINDDSGFAAQSLYFIDVKSRICKLIYQDTAFYNKSTGLSENTIRVITIYKDYIYIRNKYNQILKCSVKDIDSPKWEKVNFLNDNSIITIASYTNDSIIYCGFVKIFPKVIKSVEYNTETNKYIFCVPPFPQPARNFVTFQFYLGNKINSSECFLEIYDLYGNKKDIGINIESYLLTDNLIEFKWKSDNVESGIYLVKFSNKYTTGYTKVVIAK